MVRVKAGSGKGESRVWLGRKTGLIREKAWSG